jgi:thiol:disulfide interchange protein DsbG
VKRRPFVLSPLASLMLIACSETSTSEAQAASPKLSAQEAHALAKTGHGFSIGAVMAANTVYVFFDTTCPHCAHLWTNAQPLLGRLKMVWMPIGLLRPQSLPQGATILVAPDPVAAMNVNEQSLLNRGGGITANPSLPDEVLAKVKANTEIFRKLGADSVPLIVFRNGKSGEYGQMTGALETAQLAAIAGL